jgi:GH15 family glucan-1,4-alpha-glucosidase
LGEPPVGEHACIGDGRSTALIARGGELDWLCWPRFDSPALFAAILDARRGGSFLVGPAVPARTTRRYLPETNVVETRHETAGGALVVLDLMTAATEEEKRAALLPEREVLRIVRCERGEVPVRVRLEPRLEYGRDAARLEEAGRLGWRVPLGARAAWIRSELPLARDGAALAGHATLAAGQTIALSLSLDDDAPAVLPPLGDAAADRVARTIRFWRGFAARATYAGRWREAVVRSVLAMKLLSYAPSGALLAAATTSLPERPGGDLNWDYRYAWLRDAAFTARAFLALGYGDEAFAFADWLVHTTRLTRPELGILYDVYGRPPRGERELPWLDGHRGARPVRIRNAAADQRQLDCYGEVVDAVAQVLRAGRPLDGDTAAMLRGLRRRGGGALGRAGRGHLGGAGSAAAPRPLAAPRVGRA